MSKAKGKWMSIGWCRTTCFLLACVLFPSIATAQMYKFVDKDGITHYTNVKPVDRTDYKTFSFSGIGAYRGTAGRIGG